MIGTVTATVLGLALSTGSLDYAEQRAAKIEPVACQVEVTTGMVRTGGALVDRDACSVVLSADYFDWGRSEVCLVLVNARRILNGKRFLQGVPNGCLTKWERKQRPDPAR